MTTPARRLVVLVAAVLGCLSCASSQQGDASQAQECGAAPPGFVAHTVEAGGARLYYVVGGQGPAVLLVHGFPETWWTWREVMPALARDHTVVAADLRGVGCSSIGPPTYDAQTLAGDLHALVTALGLPRVAVVGHDTGGWVAYAYARQYRDQTSHLVLSGAALPGFGLERLLDFRQPGQGLPHLVLHSQPGATERFLRDREGEYVEHFVSSDAMRRSGAVAFYARSYARPGRLDAAFGQYRALYADAQDNLRGAGPPLAMPTLALAGDGGVGLSADGLRRVASDVRQVELPDSGHWVQEERPAQFADALGAFLRG